MSPRIPTSAKRILAEARVVLGVELQALRATTERLDDRFVHAMELLHRRKGKIVVTGVGKSGIIGQKIAATLNSTGSLAVFMHAADAAHGDLGLVVDGDVILALSHSGEAEEILAILPAARRIGAQVVALVGEERSRLARMADALVILEVPEEADHLKLAPTSSALAALAIGDAIAALLSKWRGFRTEDFALYHPGGQLGRRLLLTVRDLMRPLEETALLAPNDDVQAALEGLTRKPLGAALVLQSRRSKRLAGLITDGDLRRALFQRREEFFELCARDLMTSKPIHIGPEARAEDALRLMENRPRQIHVLPVLDGKGCALGLLRLHDLLQIGFRTSGG